MTEPLLAIYHIIIIISVISLQYKFHLLDRYTVQAPWAESEGGAREYSIYTPVDTANDDVRIRVQCPPDTTRAKVMVNVDMDPVLQ